MDFAWNKQELGLYNETLEFAAANLATSAISADEQSEFQVHLWEQCANYGVMQWRLPEVYGGNGYTPLQCALLMEALGFGCEDNGLLFALGTQLWGVQSCLLQFGNEQQKQDFLVPAAKGLKIGAYAINEPGSGSDAFSLSTRAIQDGDDYVLNGHKTLISMAGVADFALVFAVTDGEAGHWGISTFIVDTATPGFAWHPAEPMMGLRTVPFGGFSLENCRVSSDSLLGKTGSGASIFNYSQCWERSLILAPQIGSMDRLLKQCIEAAKKTSRNGQPISKNQVVSHRISNQKIRLEISRMLLYKTAWLLSEGKQNLMEAAITKVHLSEAFVDSSREAISIHGGLGYLTNHNIERQLRDAISGTIHGGTVDMQRNIIAGLLGLQV